MIHILGILGSQGDQLAAPVDVHAVDVGAFHRVSPEGSVVRGVAQGHRAIVATGQELTVRKAAHTVDFFIMTLCMKVVARKMNDCITLQLRLRSET